MAGLADVDSCPSDGFGQVRVAGGELEPGAGAPGIRDIEEAGVAVVAVGEAELIPKYRQASPGQPVWLTRGEMGGGVT